MVPDTIDFMPSDTTSSRRSGTMVPKPCDHDAERSEIGKPAHGVEQDQARARVERVSRQLRQLHIGDELVEDRLDAHQAAGGHRLIPGNADEPAYRRHRDAEQTLQRDRRPASGGSTPMMALARWTRATSTISMAQMLSRSSRPAAVPRTIASMVLDATFATSGTAVPPWCAGRPAPAP